jgi:hypothetical protein
MVLAGGHHMSAHRLTAAERDRAIGRLRDLTVGTAIAGVIAMAGLGTAAASNRGSSSATKTDNDTGAVGGSNSGPGSTSTTTTTTTTSSNAALQPAATAPTTISRKGQVSTGSS